MLSKYLENAVANMSRDYPTGTSDKFSVSFQTRYLLEFVYNDMEGAGRKNPSVSCNLFLDVEGYNSDTLTPDDSMTVSVFELIQQDVANLKHPLVVHLVRRWTKMISASPFIPPSKSKTAENHLKTISATLIKAAKKRRPSKSLCEIAKISQTELFYLGRALKIFISHEMDATRFGDSEVALLKRELLKINQDSAASGDANHLKCIEYVSNFLSSPLLPCDAEWEAWRNYYHAFRLNQGRNAFPSFRTKISRALAQMENGKDEELFSQITEAPFGLLKIMDPEKISPAREVLQFIVRG